MISGLARAALLLAALLAGGGALSASAAAAELTPDEVRARIAREFGVEVLKVEPTRRDGRPAYRVTVMNPPGNFNEAFQINVLLVDAGTGDLLPAFRHRPSGRDDNQASSRSADRQPDDAFRRGFSWR